MSRGAVAPATRPVLITGGAGFIGSNLADRLAGEGEHVLVYDSLARPGVEANLDWLRRRHPRLIATVIADIRNADALAVAASDCRAVFHLAAQVAVTTSLLDPLEDLSTNLVGTVSLLQELRRRAQPPPFVFASTNKVYGNLNDVPLAAETDAYLPIDRDLRRSGFGEDQPLDFHTPYGCSKGAADQYVLDYARTFGLPAAVLRMSCIYGPRQRGTEDQGWVAHFLLQALADAPITIYGDGRQVRDILHVADAVDAYVAAWRDIGKIQGRAFNLGGGSGNAVSLTQLLDYVADCIGRTLHLRFAPWRPDDQRYFVADASLLRRTLGLRCPIAWRDGVAGLLRWLRDEDGWAAPELARRVPVGAVPT